MIALKFFFLEIFLEPKAFNFFYDFLFLIFLRTKLPHNDFYFLIFLKYSFHLSSLLYFYYNLKSNFFFEVILRLKIEANI